LISTDGDGYNSGYAETAGIRGHLRRAGTRPHSSLIRRTVESQLIFDPRTSTRHRKPLLQESAVGAISH
jgi:hypothetical protein